MRDTISFSALTSSPKRPHSSLLAFVNFAAICTQTISLEALTFAVRLAGPLVTVFTDSMSLPYQVATLIYCFNQSDEVLLMERAQEPNLGRWSPCGGKLHQAEGESPYACACREAYEEMGLQVTISDLHLTGIVSEHGYEGRSHWLLFLFEVKTRLTALPPPHREGRFAFFPRHKLGELKLPKTDLENIWSWFWEHRNGFFAAHCHCQPDGTNHWTLEESNPRR